MGHRASNLLTVSLISSLCVLSASCSQKASEESEESDKVAAVKSNSGATEDNNAENDNADVSPYAKPANTKPTPRLMAIDLIGREISDPDPNGYHNQNWRWSIADGEIKDFKIIETLVDEAETYATIAQVRLHARGNYSYDVKLKLIYRFTLENGWKLETVLPISLQIVTDKLYDDCISIDITSDLYGTHWYIRNSSDTPLTVFYRTLLHGKWEKHLVTVNANSESKASVWSLDDCKIDYVAKDY